MENVIETIAELQSRLEREIEWPLTDHVTLAEISPMLQSINDNLTKLQTVAENIQTEELV